MPDFVVKNPKKAPIWEIIGAEFSHSDVHTAAGISIRFPRMTRIRDDKSWKEATDLEHLKKLFKISKEKSDIEVPTCDNDEAEDVDIENTDEVKTPKKTVAETKKAQKRASNSADDDKINEKKKQKKETDLEDGLPSVFQDCVIYLPKNCKDFDKLKRYIIAYV